MQMQYSTISDATERMLNRASVDSQSPPDSPIAHHRSCDKVLVLSALAVAFSLFAFTYLTIKLWNHKDNKHNVPSSNTTDIDDIEHGGLRQTILGDDKLGDDAEEFL